MKPTSLKPLLTLILALLFLGAASLPALELSGRKVVIDPGHGGSDPGATGYDGPGKPNEADFNLAVSLKLRTLLQAAGCSVVMTRSTDVAVDLYARRDLVNAESPHAGLCIHCNSFSDPGAHGTETFWCLDYCNGVAAEDQDLATKVQNRLIQFLGRANRGVKRYNFVMCSPTPPSCLAEMLFVSNQAEFNLINSTVGQDNAAAAFFYAVCDRVGVTTPAAPSGLTATAASASQINLSWNDNSGLEHSYKVERATASGGPWTEIATTAANATTYASTGLSGGTTYYYRVRAYNSHLGNSAYSGTASATTQVSGAPSITSQPASRTVDPGSTVTFTVVATGNPTLTYQWRKNAVNLSNGGKYSGATTATLTISNVQQTEVGNYSVVVTNGFGATVSANAALAVNAVIAFYDDFESPAINWTNFVPPATALTVSTAQSVSPTRSAYVNSSLDRMYRNLGVSVDGRLRITAWIYDSTQTRSFVDVRGYTGGGYNQGSLVQLFCAGKYNTVTMPGETYDATKYQGRVVSGANNGWFNLNAPGAPARSAGWHKFVIERRADGTTVDFYVDGILSRTITGTTRSSLDSAAIGSVGTGSEVLGDSWIDDVKVEYFDLPQITTQPASQTVAAGGTATFFVETANTVTAYQWQKNGTNIAGATTSALVLSNVQDSDAGSYGVTVSNGAGPVVSATATLSVAPAIVAQPLSQTNSAGATASFTVTAAGQLPLTYRWQKGGVDLADGGNISGATTPELTLNAVSQADAGSYTVAVSNAVGGVISMPAWLVVADPPDIVTPPASQAVAAGSTVTFSVVANGTPPLSYQWRFNEIAIAGATDSSYSRPDVQSADAGNYSVEVSNAAGSTISPDATLAVNTAPVLSAINDLAVHAGATATVTASAYDPDAGQTLTYSLGAGAPAGATIGAASGIFTWPTTDGDAGSNPAITITATDDGLPSLSDSTTFSIAVAAPLRIQKVEWVGGRVVLTWTAIAGRNYRVEYKDNITDLNWSNLPPDITASADTASKEDAVGAPQRFYRVLSLD